MPEEPKDPEQRELGDDHPQRRDVDPELVDRREPIIVDPRTNEVLGTVSSFSWEEFYSGPLPSPQQLHEYNEVSSGLGDRIVTEWQTEGSHRRSLEKGAMRGQLRAQSRGQWLAALVSLVVIVGGLALLFDGKSIEGLVAILAPLALLAGAFIVVESQAARGGQGTNRPDQRDEHGVQRGSRRGYARREAP